MSPKNDDTATPHPELLRTLKTRFEKNKNRHEGIRWEDVESRLLADLHKLEVLEAMESTGGEPDVIGQDPQTGAYLFADCCAESPKGRRSLCFDEEALASRKAHKPAGSAAGRAEEMGVTLLDEAQYRALQRLGDFDLKTSSWIHTPGDIRALGGALFGDRRYNTVFVYHNGAESYYAARGFRAMLRV